MDLYSGWTPNSMDFKNFNFNLSLLLICKLLRRKNTFTFFDLTKKKKIDKNKVDCFFFLYKEFKKLFLDFSSPKTFSFTRLSFDNILFSRIIKFKYLNKHQKSKAILNKKKKVCHILKSLRKLMPKAILFPIICL